MMSKRMKKTALVTSPAPAYAVGDSGYENYDYNKISSKHQRLLQDYQDLFKDSDNLKNKLANAKERKMVLSGEVRFLRKRYEYLLKIRSMDHPPPPSQEQLLAIENQSRISKKGSSALPNKRDSSSQFKLPPRPDSKRKGRVYAGKGGATKNMAPSLPPLDLNRKAPSSRARKESVVASGFLTHQQPLDSSSYRKRMINVKEAAGCVPNTETATRIPVFDLNQDNTSFSVKETSLPTRAAPIFDLNEISMEEEEIQNNISYEPMNKFEELTKRGGGLLKSGNNEDQQTADVKLSLCRNAGGEGSSRMGKRKISWQDPVALRV